MKKLGTVLLLVFTLITSSITVQTQNLTQDPLSLEERFGRTDLEVMVETSVTYITEEGIETLDQDLATQARVKYSVLLDEADSALVETGDTYTYTLDDKYQVIREETQSTEFGSFTINEDQTITLTFNASSEETIKGAVEVLVNLIKVEENKLNQDAVPKEDIITEDNLQEAGTDESLSEEQELTDNPEYIGQNLCVKFWNEGQEGATPCPPVITDFEMINGGAISLGETVKMKLEFDLFDLFGGDSNSNISESFKVGDYYEFQMPSEFKFQAPLSNGSIGTNEDGLSYGTFQVDEEGLVRLTFGEAIATENDITASIELSGQLNEQALGNPGENVIKDPFNDGQDYTITIKPDNNGALVEKKGIPNDYKNTGSIDWHILVNKGYETLTDVKIKDTLPKQLELIESGAITIRHIEYEIATGKDKPDEIYTLGDFLTLGKDYTINEKGIIEFIGEFATINKPFLIEYKTKVTDSALESLEGPFTFINEVELNSKEKTLSTEASVSVEYGKSLTKVGTILEGDKEKGIITWTIVFNDREKTFNNPVLTDVFTGSHKYLENSFKMEYTREENKEKALPSHTVTPAGDSKGLEIKFNEEIKDSFTITYQTQFDPNKPNIDGEAYENEISYEDYNAVGSVGVGENIFSKGNGDINYTDRTISWKLAVNKGNHTIENGYIRDTFKNEGLTLVLDSIVIKNINTNEILKEGVDYQVFETVNPTGFDIKFLKDIKDYHEVTYVTEFDADDAIGSTEETAKIINCAVFSGITTYGDFVTGKRCPKEIILNKATSNNGLKSGSYDASTKTITWRIHVNYNNEILKNASLVDMISENQTYLPETLVIKNFDVKKNGSILLTDEVKGLESSLDEDNNLTIKFPDGQARYYVEFKTSLVDKTIDNKYINEAIFKSDDEIRYLKASLEVPNGDKAVIKSGTHKPGQDNGTIDYNIKINPSRSKVSNIVIKDESSSNQIIIEDSLVLSNAKVDSSGNLTAGDKLQIGIDYKLVLVTNDDGSQSFELSLIGDHLVTSEAYILSYTSIINIFQEPSKQNVSNKVTIEGMGLSTEITKPDSEEVIVINDSSGNATGSSRSFSIVKVDKGTGKPLEGVDFELYRSNRLVKRDSTDKDGVIRFDRVLYGQYVLKEVKSQEGYVTSKELTDGLVINITRDNPNLVVELYNERSTLNFKKVDSFGKPISGAVFELKRENVVVDSNLVLGEKTLESLVPGSYTLTEIKAAPGFILNTSPYSFEIRLDEFGQTYAYDTDGTLLEDGIVFINYQGSVSFTKTNEANEGLEGVEFKLLNNQGDLIRENIFSDENGVVEVLSLAPGTYKFVEVASVDGYILNEEGITFTIEESADGEPQTVVVKENYINYLGKFEMYKTDNNKQGLPGAEFELTFPDNSTKILVSDSDGRIGHENLKVGNYSIRETKAPEGYILNNKVVPFEIKAVQNADDTLLVELEAFVNYQGTVRLEKHGENGILENVEFDLFRLVAKTEGTVEEYVSTGKTDSSGIVEFNELSPADYVLREVTSSLGHIVNTEPIEFEIGNEANDTEILVELEYNNYLGSFDMKKVDKLGNPIEGAKFLLEGPEGFDALYLTTDIEGKISAKSLIVGDYTLTEIQAAPGYLINTEVISFKIESEQEGSANLNVELKDFINYKGSVEFTKTDAEGNPLEGVLFDLYLEDTLLLNDIKSDSEGLVRVNELAPGNYVFKETQSVLGHIINTKEIPFTVGDKALHEPITIVLEDFVNSLGSFEMLKKDIKGNTLAGVEFELIHPDGSKEILVSDDQGLVSASNLKVGSYSLKEFKALEGFILNTKVVEFEIEESFEGDFETLILDDYINYKGIVEFTKVDEDGKVLAGAVFELEDAKGKIHTATSDSDGLVRFEELAPGAYTLREIKAPQGYSLLEDSIEVLVLDSAEDEYVLNLGSISNKLLPELPATGVSSGPNTGIYLIAAGVLLLALRDRRRRNVTA